MKDALNVRSFFARYGWSRRSMSRIAFDTSPATSNIVRTDHTVGDPSFASPFCLSTLMTACVPARLPELRRTRTRSLGRSRTVILQNEAKLSTPAWVRESDAKMIPSFRRMPTQYVMPALSDMRGGANAFDVAHGRGRLAGARLRRSPTRDRRYVRIERSVCDARPRASPLWPDWRRGTTSSVRTAKL